MTFFVPTSNFTATQLLASRDTLYLDAGLRITNGLSAIAQSTATSNTIRVSIDGAVSSASSAEGTINLLGTDTSTTTGVGNNAVYVGQSGSVTNLAGDGIHLAGAFGRVDNAGNIQSRQFGVLIDGTNAVVSNAGSMQGNASAVVVLGLGAQISNTGTMQSNGTTVSITGAFSGLINAGQISSFGVGVAFSGASCAISNSGTIHSQGTAALITGTLGQISNNGTIHAQGRGLQITGADGIISNDGIISARGDAIVLFADNGVARNTGQVSGNVGILANAISSLVVNTGDVAGIVDHIMSIGGDNSVRNTATGHVTTSQGSEGAITLRVLAGTAGSMVNTGIAEGDRTALLLKGNGSPIDTFASIANTGTLSGGSEAVVLNIVSVQMVNTGVIDGGADGHPQCAGPVIADPSEQGHD